MPIFKRIKIQATVETAAMLLPESQVAHTIGRLRERLRQLDLSIVSLESIEPSAVTDHRKVRPARRNSVARTSRLRRPA